MLGGVLDTAWFWGNDAHLEEAVDVVFWVGCEICSRSKRHASTWFLKIEPLNASFTQGCERYFEFVKLFPPRMNVDLSISSSECAITLSPRPRLLAEWRAKVDVFAQVGDTSGWKVYQGKRKSLFSRAPVDGQWMKMEIVAGQCLLTSVTPPSTFISFHHFLVFTHRINRAAWSVWIEISWQSNDKKYQ